MRAKAASGYNFSALKLSRIFAVAFISLFSCSCLLAQSPATLTRTVLILPFENRSQAPGLEWIAESFPELVGESLSSPEIYVVPREDRNYAFDRAGISENLHLSRITLYQIAEQMDADYVVLGSYNYDGETFTATAQLLDMKKLHLSPELREQAPLVNMVELQRALAWDLLKELSPQELRPRAAFIASFPPIRLDAFENYVRGVVATERTYKVRRFREAVRLNPSFTEAMFQLGKTYFDNREYESAASWFARIPRQDALARQASFLLGLSAYFTGEYARAEQAFNFLVEIFPLTEVYNNLAIVAGRRNRRTEIEYLQKALDVDPNDPDYHFNLAVAYARIGDHANAGRQLRETLRLRPGDAEAKTFLDSFSAPDSLRVSAPNGGGSLPRLPLERMKRNYDETSYRQLALEIQRTAEMRLAKMDPQTHAKYHVDRGREMLDRGFAAEAEVSFREAVGLDPANSAAHLGLATALLDKGDTAGAEREAQAALQLQSSAGAHLLLARAYLQQNKLDAASDQISRALALDANNATGLQLKRDLEQKLTEKK